MANRFWVGGAGTWDSTTTTNWSATSGGAGGASAPVASDNITFDASSGSGTVTVASSVAGIAFGNLVAGAFTGTIDWSVNNPSMSFTQMNMSGTGTRKFLMGSGTFTLVSSASVTVWDLGTTTNLDGTSVFTSNFTITGTTTSNRTFSGGGKTYGAFTVSSNTSRGFIIISGANTFSSISIASGMSVDLPQGVTTTVSNAMTWTGSSSNPIYVKTSAPNSGVATLSIASGTTALDWCGLYGVTATGGGTFNATNSLDFGRNTGWSITAPSGGASSGGQRVISG